MSSSSSKLFMLAIISVTNCLVGLGLYEGYKAVYWERGHSLVEYHKDRIHNTQQEAVKHMKSVEDQLIDVKNMTSSFQQLNILKNKAVNGKDEKEREAAKKLATEMEDSIETIIKPVKDWVEKTHGISDARDYYSPVTSLLMYQHDYTTPLDFIFYMSGITVFFCIVGISGMVSGQRNLVQYFIIFSMLHFVLSFYYIIDAIVVTARNKPLENVEELKKGVDSMEYLLVAYLFVGFVIDCCVCFLGAKAMIEFREKKRDNYSPL